MTSQSVASYPYRATHVVRLALPHTPDRVRGEQGGHKTRLYERNNPLILDAAAY